MNIIKGYNPYHYQKVSIEKGIEILNLYNSLFLLDETGLGKTVTAATIVNTLKPKSVLIICPKAQFNSWKQIMDLTDVNYIISGNRAIPFYETFYDFIIIDECHKIGNSGGKTYDNIYKLIKYNESKLIQISATPYNNKIYNFIDLVALFNLPENSIPFLGLNFSLDRAAYYSEEMSVLNRSKDEHGYIPARLRSKELETIIGLRGELHKISQYLNFISIRNMREKIKMDDRNLDVFKSFPDVIKTTIEPQYNSDFYRPILNLLDKYKSTWQNQISYFDNKEYESFGPIYISFLYKRLESSFAAFFESIGNTISHINEYLHVTELNEQNQKFITDLNYDLNILNEIYQYHDKVNDNAKLEALYTNIDLDGKNVIFTEYKASFNIIVDYLANKSLNLITYSSDEIDEKIFEKIALDFDANSDKHSNKYNVLVCTDALAEGQNLHRAKTLIHFDQKWNPSKIIQREGRINRIRKDGIKTTIFVKSISSHYYIENKIKLTEKQEDKEFFANLILDLKENDYNIINNINEIPVYYDENHRYSSLHVLTPIIEGGYILTKNGEISHESIDEFGFLAYLRDDQIHISSNLKIDNNLGRSGRSKKNKTGGIRYFYDTINKLYNQKIKVNLLYQSSILFSPFTDIVKNCVTEKFQGNSSNDSFIIKMFNNPNDWYAYYMTSRENTNKFLKSELRVKNDLKEKDQII